MTDSENIAATSAFNLTDRVPIFSYLVSINRVRWYRAIMRIFLQRHRELYRYQLTAMEIRDAVRDAFDPEYTLEQCQNDLAALKEWGNVTTIYDSSRASTIASFLSPALLYQATPEAMAIETFLAEQMRATATSGALRQSDLPRLWQSLQLIHEGLSLSPNALRPARSREIAEEWQRAFDIWNTLAREAAQYLANMTNAAQQVRPDLEAYQLYKAAVVTYVHSFAQALTQYSRRVREQLTSWDETGQRNLLLTIVAEHLDPPSPTLENRRTQDELLQEASNQFEALENWFAPGKNADSFRRNALAEVDKVVRRATTLVVSARPNANYATHLNALAHQLLATRDGETAQQLFSIAFANLLPVHLPESFVGSPSASYEPEQADLWQQPPAVTLHLRPVGRSNRGDHHFEDPVIDNRTIMRALVVQHEQKLKEQRERVARLFRHGPLDIGAIEAIAPEDRAALLEIIDACLGRSDHQYQAPDGSIITLLNPEPATYAMLDAPDGTLLLPRYRLERQGQEETPAREGEEAVAVSSGGGYNRIADGQQEVGSNGQRGDGRAHR